MANFDILTIYGLRLSKIDSASYYEKDFNVVQKDDA